MSSTHTKYRKRVNDAEGQVDWSLDGHRTTVQIVVTPRNGAGDPITPLAGTVEIEVGVPTQPATLRFREADIDLTQGPARITYTGVFSHVTATTNGVTGDDYVDLYCSYVR